MDNYEAAQMQGALDRMRARAQRAEDNANDLRAKLAEAYRALDYFSQPLEDLRAMKIREAELGTLIAAREFVERENEEKPND